MNIVPGRSAVIDVGVLQPADPERPVELVSATVHGLGIDASVGRLEGVRVYQVNAQGGIGAITSDELSGVDDGTG